MTEDELLGVKKQVKNISILIWFIMPLTSTVTVNMLQNLKLYWTISLLAKYEH